MCLLSLLSTEVLEEALDVLICFASFSSVWFMMILLSVTARPGVKLWLLLQGKWHRIESTRRLLRTKEREMSAWHEVVRMVSLQKYLSRFVVVVLRHCYKEQNEFLNCIGNVWAAKHLQMNINTCSLKVRQVCQKRGAKAVFLILFLGSNKLIWGISKWSDCICGWLEWWQVKFSTCDCISLFFLNYCFLEHIIGK